MEAWRRFIRYEQQDFPPLGAGVQQVLFPPSIKDFVPQNHFAHFVRDLVRNDLNLSGILARYSELRGCGEDSKHGLELPQKHASDLRSGAMPMMDQIEKNTGCLPKETSADTGYCSEKNIEALEAREIRGYIATGRQKHGTASATGNEEKRQGPRTRAMRTRLRRGGWRSHYRLRKHTVEPVFGQIKEAQKASAASFDEVSRM